MSISIKIQSQFNTNRTRFVFDLIFKQLLDIEYETVVDAKGAHIIYSSEAIESKSIQIPVYENFLNCQGAKPMEVPYINSGKETKLFPIDTANSSAWDFDLFAAVFYLVSRYEEYEGLEPDDHGRFHPHSSILHQTHSFEYPLVNIWIRDLALKLKSIFPELIFHPPKFRFISTIDVDSTYQYKEKGVLWSSIGLAKDLIKGQFSEVYNRILCLLGIKKDAFDVFEEINQLHSMYSTEVIYFFLLANYNPYDKNIGWKNKKQAKLIKFLSKKYPIGIHPSYQSNAKPQLLPTEINRLKAITGIKPSLSRQHFLKHRYPQTFQNLIKNEIKADYTLGYTSQYGFRAGIASPFLFYDLSQEKCCDLMLYPFCSMDITPLHYYQLSPEQAIEKNLELLKRVKEVNGTFISLWHNESLSGQLRWKGGWPLVYQQLMADAHQQMNS